jgi:hypothetical protein
MAHSPTHPHQAVGCQRGRKQRRWRRCGRRRGGWAAWGEDEIGRINILLFFLTEMQDFYWACKKQICSLRIFRKLSCMLLYFGIWRSKQIHEHCHCTRVQNHRVNLGGEEKARNLHLHGNGGAQYLLRSDRLRSCHHQDSGVSDGSTVMSRTNSTGYN